MSTLTIDAEYPVIIPGKEVPLHGILHLPEDARALIVFAHGSGSSRFSSRNQFVAQTLQDARLATLLFDLLTPEEDAEDAQTLAFRFNIEFLASRLLQATDWIIRQSLVQDLPVAYFGASTGAGAAIVAAAERPKIIKALVSRGGRPDLAGEALSRLEAPTLLIVGGDDASVIDLNKQALTHMKAHHQLEIVPHATHLFEEPGALAKVAKLAENWFSKYLGNRT